MCCTAIDTSLEGLLVMSCTAISFCALSYWFEDSSPPLTFSAP